MCGRQARTKLLRYFNRLIVGQSANAAQQRPQILAVHQLHRKKQLPVAFPDIVNAANIRVRYLPRHAHFGIELAPPTGALQPVRGQKLEGHALTELQVLGAIDLAHASAAEQRDHPVAISDQAAGGKAD